MFNVIISYGTLHFVEKEQWKIFIANSKIYTSIGGLNIFQIFTDKVPTSDDIKLFVKGLADEKELESLYQDWKIESSEAQVSEDEHPGVCRHLHSSNTVVARRII